MVNDDAQAHTFTVQTALTGSAMMPKSTVHNFTVQTALTWSTMMPKHIPSQCKQLWQGQCRCPSTYLHSANSFDRVNVDAQAHTFTEQTALTGSVSMPKHIPSQCKQLWQDQWRCRFPPAPVCRPWGHPGQQCTATVHRRCLATAAGDCSLLHWSEEEKEAEFLGLCWNLHREDGKETAKYSGLNGQKHRGRHTPISRTDIYWHGQTDRQAHTHICTHIIYKI